jgi:hypothetical protein
VAVLLAVLVAGACGSSQQLGTAAPASAQSSAASSGASPTEAPASASTAASGAPAASDTPAPSDAGVTPEPATPAPTAAAATEPVITNRFFKVWTDSISYAHYEAIIEVSNGTANPVDIGGGSQDFTIYAKDGTVLSTGSFSYAFPKVVAPGEKGYLISSSTFDQGVKAKTVGKFEESLSWSEGTEATPVFKVSAVKVSQESYGSGLQVSAVVTNTTGTDATMAVAGFVFFDGSGHIIGGLYDNMVGNVFAGKSKGVKTSYPGTPPLKPSAVKKTFSCAFNDTF